MKLFLSVALTLHIVSGFLALGFGLSALLAPKGRRLHLLSGRTFFYLMLLVALTAAAISTVKPNHFLLLIAGFAFYQNVQGYRSIRNKTLRPRWIDWSVTAIGLITAAAMISTLNLVLLIFGGIGLYLVALDLRTYAAVLRGKTLPRLVWLSRHIGMMTGAYIATVTAFVVVNVRHVEPAWLPWLLPTMIGVPLMRWWDRKYVKKEKWKT